ncbi:MAG: neutral/alkaline non-lysosomal ceramidase N-terminal domain-containing protein [Chloroflexi bacterium]|nr:neutral/alkaline non-lysosomal ceramidase N-terminal domain-containing protein [Chloroflexota bacterium]MCC6893226.1 neutral/alkaline non-lysosomal ceramidase N-terminal domain-containing protein [Anaerolineae bacterium]
MTKELFVGVAEVDITPPAGLLMDGYMARDGGSTGTHDPLMAQVLVLRNDEKTLAVVALDILAVSVRFTTPLRQTLAALLDTQPEAIMIAPSHTHCGPRGLQGWFPMGKEPALDESLVKAITEKLTTAAQAALTGLEPVGLVWRTGTVEGIGTDRNQPDVPVDQTVTTLCCERDDGSVKSILFHYACHPTILSAATREYSADFVGAARNRLKRDYPQAVRLFVNGAQGDISSRFRRRDQSFAEVERMGTHLAEIILDMLKQPQAPDTNTTLAYDGQPISLPFRDLASAAAPEMTNADMTTRIEQTRAEGKMLQAKLQQMLDGRTAHDTLLNRLTIGSWRLFGIPGEPFNQIATNVRQADPHALVVALANDYAGYFPSQTAIDNMTYEALSSPYDARALNLIQSTLLAE